jgi:hypothetical protein
MSYLESYQFIFRSPRGLKNLLSCAVGLLVPIAGQMVVLGYHFDIIESLHLRGRQSYPDFDTNRLVKYLVRGAWPFLVQLIIGMVAGMLPVIPIIVCYFGFFISLMQNLQGAPGSSSAGVVIWGIFLGLSVLFSLLIDVAAAVILVPMTLRAGLMQDFGAGFSWPFIRDFMGRMWGRTVLAELFLIVTAIPLTFLGLLLCIVGAYPAGAWVQFARAYLLFELYEEYLKRGGMEIPLQVETTQPPVGAYEE